MPVVAGVLFAVGVAALLFAAIAGWPWSGGGLAPSLAALLGLGALTASWGLLMVQVVRSARKLTGASHRLDEWAMDLQRERARSEQPADSPWPAVQRLFGDLFAAVARTGPHPDLTAVRQAFEGLGTTSHAELVTLEDLLDETERLCDTVYPGPVGAAQRVLEPHPAMEIDRARVVAILVQIVAAARQQAAWALEPSVRIEAAEWQAGLLRVRVTATGPLPGPEDARAAGLAIAAASAATLGGSLSTEVEGDHCRMVLLLPLDEPDVRTDPTPMSPPRRSSEPDPP